MDAVTEGLKGLDALAKLVVCTIGLFCVPVLTRKYAQNLGLSAGQSIMNKAFFAAHVAGLPHVGMAMKKAAKSMVSTPKQWIASGGRQALIGGEKLGRRLLDPSSPPSHPKFQSQIEDQAIKNKMMKEKGAAPWTKKDEKQLDRSKNPLEIKALAQKRQDSMQFEKAWSQMKATQSQQSQNSSISSAHKIEAPRTLMQSAPSSLAKQFSSSSSFLRQDSGQQSPQVSQNRTSMDKTSGSMAQMKSSSRLEPSTRASTWRQKSSFQKASASPSQRPTAQDLYARYQQIQNQNHTWKRKGAKS